MKEYAEKVKCPRCETRFVQGRRVSSIGKIVATWCSFCRKSFKWKAKSPQRQPSGETEGL